MRKKTKLPSLKYLQDRFSYDPKSGELTWKTRPRHHFQSSMVWKTWNTKWAGKKVGSVDSKGHGRLLVKGKPTGVHRVCWKLYYGHDPVNDIDHIDHNPLNNRIDNLRDVTHRENCRNLKLNRNNKSGHMGVFWIAKLGKWQAKIRDNYKDVNLGFYLTLDEAISARKEGEKIYGYHENHGVTNEAKAA